MTISDLKKFYPKAYNALLVESAKQNRIIKDNSIDRSIIWHQTSQGRAFWTILNMRFPVEREAIISEISADPQASQYINLLILDKKILKIKLS